MIPAYRFASDAQWRQALCPGLAPATLLDPRTGVEVARGACDLRDLLVDGDEMLLLDCEGILSTEAGCGTVLGAVDRLTRWRDRIRGLGEGRIVELDARTFQILGEEDATGVVDIAGGATLDQDGRMQRADGSVLTLPDAAVSLAAAGGTLIALDSDRAGLTLIMPGGIRRLALADALDGLLPDWGAFVPDRLSGSAQAVLAVGRWADGAAGLLLFDDQGSIVGRVKWAGTAAPQTVALVGGALFSAFGARLLRFDLPAEGAGGMLRLTPALETQTLAGNWLRAEVDARLAEGATLSYRWAASDDAGLRATIDAIHHDESRTAAARAAAIAGLLAGRWSDSFAYEGLADASGTEHFSFPLHDVPRGAVLWVELRLEGGTGQSAIAGLTLFHDDEGLMANLPAIYRGQGDADGSYRRLVDIVEATTYSIDDRIARLAELLDPAVAEARWLPMLAAMLGLPFDAVLDEAMQRRLVAAAPALLEYRGTRAGIEHLLGAIFPGRPIRIVDRATTTIAIMLGGGSLPGLLAGPAARMPRLNARLVLGRTRICPADPCDEGLIAPAAAVIVTIPATPRERARLAAAVRQMLEAMIPAGIVLRVRWTRWAGGTAADPRDVLTAVDAPEPARVGTGAVGSARLGGRADPAIGAEGFVALGHRLI